MSSLRAIIRLELGSLVEVPGVRTSTGWHSRNALAGTSGKTGARGRGAHPEAGLFRASTALDLAVEVLGRLGQGRLGLAEAIQLGGRQNGLQRLGLLLVHPPRVVCCRVLRARLVSAGVFRERNLIQGGKGPIRLLRSQVEVALQIGRRGAGRPAGRLGGFLLLVTC